MEHVNHPKHYNSHPAGIECIDIIRHYTCDIANAIKYLWRAGLKPEMGKEDAEKEIEDLKKALWYIEDYKKNFIIDCTAQTLNIPRPTSVLRRIKPSDLPSAMDGLIEAKTGHKVSDITKGYCDDVKRAMTALLRIGLIASGEVFVDTEWTYFISKATNSIQKRISDIECMLTDKELHGALNAMNGVATDGEDYISKPGCNRETEPEHYDPLNMIVAFGRVYSLTNKVRKRDNGSLHSPCENCDLRYDCLSDDGTEPMKYLCRLHQAETDEYYEEVGIAKYSPSFGTVEVVDEYKETSLKLKRLEEEEKEYD